MSDVSRGSRWRGAGGQATSEYVVLTGMVVLFATMIFNLLGGSLRDAFKYAARQVLSVVTGAP